MNCEKIREHLSAFLDGELRGRLLRRVTAHLGACSACRSELDTLRKVSGAIRELPKTSAPEWFRAEVMRRAPVEVRREIVRDWSPRKSWAFGFTVGAVAAGLLTLALVVPLFLQREKTYPEASDIGKGESLSANGFREAGEKSHIAVAEKERVKGTATTAAEPTPTVAAKPGEVTVADALETPRVTEDLSNKAVGFAYDRNEKAGAGGGLAAKAPAAEARLAARSAEMKAGKVTEEGARKPVSAEVLQLPRSSLLQKVVHVRAIDTNKGLSVVLQNMEALQVPYEVRSAVPEENGEGLEKDKGETPRQLVVEAVMNEGQFIEYLIRLATTKGVERLIVPTQAVRPTAGFRVEDAKEERSRRAAESLMNVQNYIYVVSEEAGEEEIP